MRMVERHFAWFRHDTGAWLAEWSGRVPAPNIPDKIIGDARLARLNKWQQSVTAKLKPEHTIAEAIDAEAWQACPAGEAVCLDVTQFCWPVGDHIWHRWDEIGRMLDWGPEHKFIEVRMDTLEIVANQSSHRPIRDAVPGQRVFDLTETPWAEFHGCIWGRFVWRADEARWGFEPTQQRTWTWSWRSLHWSLRTFGRRWVPLATQQALAGAPIDLDLGVPIADRRAKVIA